MTESDTPRTVEDRLAAIETTLGLRVPEWTAEQVAEFEQAWAEASKQPPRLIEPFPPKLALTPEAARALLREYVTVVKPGETLVIRCPDWWGPAQVQEYQHWLDSHPAREGFRALAVIGEELGIAESKEDATA